MNCSLGTDTLFFIFFISQGEVTDRTNILNWFMEKDNVLPRLSSRVLAPPTLKVDLAGTAGLFAKLISHLADHSG